MDFNTTFLNTSTLEESVTKKDLEELKIKMEKMERNVLKEHQITQKLLKRVLEEVKSNASGHSKTTSRKPILPKTPFKDNAEFKEFEQKIQTSENKFADLVAELMAIVCGNSSKFLKMAWRKLIADEVAQKYCWQGSKDKQAIRPLSVTTALKQAYTQKFAGAASDAEFEKTIISFFQHAANRLKKKNKYSKEKAQTEST